MESQDLERHKQHSDEEPDVEAHRHKARHTRLTEDGDDSSEPDVEAHRFVQRHQSHDDLGGPEANRLGGRG